jgi:hypothetical protein
MKRRRTPIVPLVRMEELAERSGGFVLRNGLEELERGCESVLQAHLVRGAKSSISGSKW